MLIIAPLAVVGQTIAEGEKFGYEVIELNERPIRGGLYITNYDNIKNVVAKDYALTTLTAEWSFLIRNPQIMRICLSLMLW